MGVEHFALGLLGIALIFYGVLGGADFGAGIWEFHTAFQSTRKERQLVQKAIGPIWEANHVWLIFAIVVAHTAFPRAFIAVSQALWLPLFLALAGIVFRGIGFVFRKYAVGDPEQQSLWGTVFALASTAAPFFLGACAGAVASGQLEITPDGRFHGSFAFGWMTPLGIFTSFYAVGVCSFLAAVYVTRDATREGDAELVETWRRRALATGIWMGILSAVGLMLLALEAPELWSGFRGRGAPLVMASSACGLWSLLALQRRRFTQAGIAAAAAIAAVLGGWMIAQYPYLIPPSVSVEASKAPDNVIRMMLIGAVGGTVLLLPALAWLFYLFKWKPADSVDSVDSVESS